MGPVVAVSGGSVGSRRVVCSCRGMRKGSRAACAVRDPCPMLWSGGVLLSHTLPSAVPLPCWVLASGFGMGPGVSPRP